MRYGDEDYLPAEPFVCFVEAEYEGCGSRIGVCAARLGIAERTLRRFLDREDDLGRPLTRLPLATVDRALTAAGVALAHVYEDAEPGHDAQTRYCPACRELALVDSERRCLWCQGRTIISRARPQTRSNRGRRMSEAQLRSAHVVYERPMGAPELAALIWERFGFASQKSCETALYDGFHALGLPVRNEGWAHVTHGLTRADGGDPAAYSDYLKARRREQGGARRCMGVRTWYPRKGERCGLYAPAGSDYCVWHDPALSAVREARMAALRERKAARQRDVIGDYRTKRKDARKRETERAAVTA